ncbi:hypothetical protein E3P91_01794 [Wallemia ichthyophaga]|nr:hypothetical protein E3P91_01794 [Wallemia ichthyophaga]TIB63640.1 hypothetical protein E3P78_01721 [Wallemia ichthyophaga]
MSEKAREMIEIPQQFLKEGSQVYQAKPARLVDFLGRLALLTYKEEYIQICKAVAIGFAIMGFIGYFVKLIHIPINNILV